VFFEHDPVVAADSSGNATENAGSNRCCKLLKPPLWKTFALASSAGVVCTTWPRWWTAPRSPSPRRSATPPAPTSSGHCAGSAWRSWPGTAPAIACCRRS
jgi:hypothetical protein